MLIYYIILCIIYFLGILEILTNQRKDRKLLFFIILLLLIWFVGFKAEGGTDFLNYKRLYESYTDFSSDVFNDSLEPIFVLLILLVKGIGGSYFLFNFIISCINISGKLCIFSKLTPYLYPALLVYFAGLFFERDNDGIRQGLSILFSYISIPYLINGKTNKFLFFNSVAFFIHYSSIVFVLLYYIKKVRISDKIAAGIILLAFTFPFLHVSLFELLLSVIPIPIVKTKLLIYSQSSEASSNLGINIGILFRLILLLLFMYYHRSLKISNDLYYVLRNGFAFAIILSLLFSDFEIIAHRLPYAFRELQIFIAPYFLTVSKGKENKILVLTIILIYSTLIISRFLINNPEAYNYRNLLY